MKRILFTILWMLGFAAITALLGIGTVTILVHTAREVGTVMYTQTVLGVLFIVSPLIALFLSVRGSLPGTKQRTITDAV